MIHLHRLIKYDRLNKTIVHGIKLRVTWDNRALLRYDLLALLQGTTINAIDLIDVILYEINSIFAIIISARE
jgi:hypothetical protein